MPDSTAKLCTMFENHVYQLRADILPEILQVHLELKMIVKIKSNKFYMWSILWDSQNIVSVCL